MKEHSEGDSETRRVFMEPALSEMSGEVRVAAGMCREMGAQTAGVSGVVHTPIWPSQRCIKGSGALFKKKYSGTLR